MHLKTRIVGAVLFAATLALQAGATEVKSTSYSSWLATVSGTPAEWNFVIPGGTVLNTAAGYNMTVGSFGPINISGPDGSGYTMTESSSGSIALIGASDGIGVLNFVTPARGLTAFGLGIGLLDKTAPVTLTLSDGETFTLNPTVNGSVFIGLSSTTPITSFVLSTTSGAQVEMNDFLAAASNESPSTTQSPAAEAATAVMIGSGLLFFVARRKLFSTLSTSRA